VSAVDARLVLLALGIQRRIIPVRLKQVRAARAKQCSATDLAIGQLPDVPERRRAHTRANLGVVRRRRKRKEDQDASGDDGALVFRDPTQDDRVWVIFDWDLEGWQSFASDPEVPPIMQEAGHKSRPQVPELSGLYEA
jgi:hypothetical protein